ncbi:helix-turn-helix domain-containing protein [Candidatus Saccharibacteria bacterium]|nr:helix-turn-helix domain-containing protein [Candidatus Saccharibacteria bacterium]
MKSPKNSQKFERAAFTIDEWCEMWDCGRNTAYNEIASGALESIKIGRCRRITREQNERYRKRKESQGA